MQYMFINLHIKDMLNFYEVIAEALYKYKRNATKKSGEKWFTPHLDRNQNIQAVTTQRRLYITKFFNICMSMLGKASKRKKKLFNSGIARKCVCVCGVTLARIFWTPFFY